MPTDFAYTAFFLPVLVCIGLLVVFALSGKPAQAGAKPFLGLGRVRLARGYLGALLATLVCTVISATELGFDKVSLGHITHAELRHLLPGYILYFFVLHTPFVLAALTIIGLPALAVMRRFNVMSISWASALAVAFSIGTGVLIMLDPYNQWCGTHLAECGGKAALSTAFLALPVVIGFGLSARVPLRRSKRPA